MSSERRPIVPLHSGDRASTLTRDQIKRQHKPSDTWISPRHGDGGWHTTPGTQDPDIAERIIPLRDRITVQLFPVPLPYVRITTPQIGSLAHESRRGVILKVGPGRWIDGEFYPTEVKPGMEVTIGRWDDWNLLDAGWGNEVVICQEADIRVIHNREFSWEDSRYKEHAKVAF